MTIPVRLDQSSTQGSTARGIGLLSTIVLTAAAGTSVAVVYLAQPLLASIGAAFDTTPGAAGWTVTAAQLGYALGLALLVPLGDIVPRQRLAGSMLGLEAIALTAVALVPTLAGLVLALVAAGALAAVAQVVVPAAAAMATDEQRGKVVGVVVGGVLIGISLGRTAAGVFGDLLGWRGVYGVAAVLTAVLAVGVLRVIPPRGPELRVTYPALLASVLRLVRDEAMLRSRMMMGACGLAGFTLLWTSSSLLLGDRFSLSPGAIGAVGLVGLTGATASLAIGPLTALRAGRPVVTGALIVLIAVWSALVVTSASTPPVVLGAVIGAMVLLNLAQQALQISYQTALYERYPRARSRVTTALMVASFLGGSVASAATALLYPLIGWSGLCLLGLVLALFAALVWARESHRRPRTISTGRTTHE